MDKFNFITIGYDCSPASALRGLNMRQFALPFDWVESNITSLENKEILNQMEELKKRINKLDKTYTMN